MHGQRFSRLCKELSSGASQQTPLQVVEPTSCADLDYEMPKVHLAPVGFYYAH